MADALRRERTSVRGVPQLKKNFLDIDSELRTALRVLLTVCDIASSLQSGKGMKMKRILATTALVSLLAAPVFAQESTTPTAPAESETTAPSMDYSSSSAPVVGGEEILASDFIDRPVYVGTIAGDAAMADASADWDHIGEISDVIMTKDGAIHSVLVDVGGFLGMGEHTVKVDLAELSIVQDSDNPDDVFIVSDLSREELEAMPEFDEAGEGQTRLSAAGEADPKTSAAPETDTAMAPEAESDAQVGAAEETAPAAEGIAPADGTAMTAADEQQWIEADFSKLTADDLQDATVYSSTDEPIGEISALYLEKDGKISAAVVDVGGFLGINEKPVSLPFDSLKVMQTEDGGRIRILVDETRESLESMPGYKS